MEIRTCLSWGKCCNCEMNWQLIRKIWGKDHCIVESFSPERMLRFPDQTCLSTLSSTCNNSQSFYVLARSGDQLELWSIPHFEELLQDTSPAVFPFLLKIKKCCFQKFYSSQNIFFFFSIEVELIYKVVSFSCNTN